MGYFLLYESMLDCVLWARDKYLAKDGLMLPDKIHMYIAAVEDGQYKRQKRTFWKDVYGVDMSCMVPTVMRDPLIDVVPSNAIISSSDKILEIDLCTMKPSEVEFCSTYALRMKHNDTVHGLVAWWDAEFLRLPNPVTLSTSPYSKATHWKQTLFYTSSDVDVKRGDVLKGSIANRKSLTNFRELDIKISYHLVNEAENLNRKVAVDLFKLR